MKLTMAVIGAALLTLILSPATRPLFRRDFPLKSVDWAPIFRQHTKGARTA